LTRPRLVAVALGASLLAAGCGGSSHRTSDRLTPTLVVLQATGPDSLDPAVGDTPQALEADWLAYTPLLTYVHSAGDPGTRITTGLAVDYPTISDGGRTYTLNLRSGLIYSNGQPVRASDFAWAVERAIKLWPSAEQFIISRIVGARAFTAGRSRTISGITTDDATGLITIRLTAPSGAFENVLASPSTAPVPAGTPFSDQGSSPPPGVGPYEIANVVVGKSFSLVKSPTWRREPVLDLPGAYVNVDVRITGDARANALSVLNNTADVFDWTDQIPSDLLPQIEKVAGDRFATHVVDSTNVIFMNVARKPFSSQSARQAVRAALDQNTLDQLDPGTLLSGCYLIPPTLYGHPHDACPEGNPAGGGNLALAKTLVQRSGMGGVPVTVWSQTGSPSRSWMTYYTSLLNQIGFKASLKLVPDQSYYETVGELKRHPQTGFAGFDADFPNPLGFYEPLTGKAIQPTGNRNLSELDDPVINATVRALAAVPASNLSAVYNFWNQLELYVANKAYLAVLGYPTFPEFVSDRVNRRALIFSPVVGYDWTSLRLK
jgi:peptide/nickel transport system substrate-binding protein